MMARGALALLCFWLIAAPCCFAQGPDLAGHPVRSLAWWRERPMSRPLESRVAPASHEIIDYLRQDYTQWGANPAETTAIQPFTTPEVESLVKASLTSIVAALPPHLQKVLQERLLGVFIAQELGSSGYTESVYATGGDAAHAFIVLDGALLGQRRANAWASYRESSFFAPEENGPTITMRIAADKQDNSFEAVRYILLHELGHCLGIMTGAHPDWNAPPDQTVTSFPFVDASWLLDTSGDAARYVSRFAKSFPWRSKLRIYSFANAPLVITQAPEVYSALIRSTNYPSLYAAVNPYEDFAESFAVYQHAIQEGRPWQVIVSGAPGNKSQKLTTCFRNNLCPQKQQFMERWFNRP